MSVTAVPLRPVSKGGIALLWAGLLLLMLGAVAWAMLLSNPSTIRIETVTAGSGAFPTDTDVAIIKYEGRLADGTVFDAGDNTPLPVGRMIPGFAMGLKRMQAGGKYVLHIPAELAYGAEGAGPIPGNSDLVFDVEIKEIRSEAEMQAMMQQQQMIEQMMQQQGQGGPNGAPGGGAPPQP